MSELKTFLLCGLLTLGMISSPAFGQSPAGDTVITIGGEIRDEAFFLGDTISLLKWGDTLRVVRDTTVEATGSKKKTYLWVVHKGKEGWLDGEKAMSFQEFEREFQTTRDEAIAKGGGWSRIQLDKIGRPRSIPERGDTVKVIGKMEGRFRVIHEGKEGWIREEKVMSEKEEREYQRELEAQRRRARQRRKYLQGLREKGYTIVLTRQTFAKNSADGVSIGLGVVNISQAKTIKYLRITWKLFNPVGDPAPGENTGNATAQTRLVGPINPGGTSYTEFENVWYSPTGTCAEIRGIEVEHIDGSTFTYVNDLQDIAQQAESVRLMGDCSYEAQQERKN